jgi:hypothetical protein
MRVRLGRLGVVCALSAATILAGCAALPDDVQARCDRGYVFYLDGAGGGGALIHQSSGIREGLRSAGYPGWGEMYSWETGLSLVVDQTASNEYKRAKATELAQKIVTFHRDHPQAPITLVAFSAGTVIAVYTLEALPNRPIVENAVLLAGSMSADYDLTSALARVRQNVYVFTSDRDVVLTVLLPILGPADRGADTNSVLGTTGPVIPANPSPETASQYTKVIEVRWNPSFRDFGHGGDHLNTVNASFIRAFIAPLVFVAPASVAGPCPPLGKVRSPDYQAWAPFAPGSWAVLEGTCTRDGHTEPCRVKSTLVSKTSDSAVIEHELTINNERPAEIPFRPRSIVIANIDSHEHPITHSDATVRRIGQVDALIQGKSTKCCITRIGVKSEFDFWGENICAETYTASVVPGLLARVDLSTTLDGKQYEFALRATDYSVASRPIHAATEVGAVKPLEPRIRAAEPQSAGRSCSAPFAPIRPAQ